jgi:protein-disulfide isomerase
MRSRGWRVALSVVAGVALWAAFIVPALLGADASSFLNALGAPPPSARAAALEDSLSSRGPRAFLHALGAPPPSARAAALDDSLSSRPSIHSGRGEPVEPRGPRALQTQEDLDKQFLDAWALQPRVNPGAPSAGAKVVVVKYNDWMCPGCKAAYETFKPILDKYQATPGALRYVEKDWPWNTRCNPATDQTFQGHEASCEAAAAVRIAADRGKRDLMVTWLFANQEGMTPEKVKAKTIEMLTVKDFAAAYALKLPEIRKDVIDGRAVAIRSTPTYFVNGVRAADQEGRTIPAHYFELAIQYELRKNGGK